MFVARARFAGTPGFPGLRGIAGHCGIDPGTKRNRNGNVVLVRGRLRPPGGAAGLALASAGLALLRRIAPHVLPADAELSLDPGAVMVTAAVAVAVGLAFGLAPAVAAGRSNVQGTLRDETRGTSESRRTRTLRGLLVAGQIALCVSLLTGAGLLARTLWAISSTPLCCLTP